MRILAAVPVACAFALPAAAASPSPTTIKYVVTMADHAAGAETVTIGADGTREYDYEYNDRGRGPKIHARIRLAADGTIASYQSSGHNRLKEPIVESFEVAQGRARWQSSVEHGEAAARRAFYTSYYGVPDETGLMAAALLRAPDHTLPLLPAGRAHLEEIGRKQVTANGATRTVIEYAISGLELS